MDIVERQRAILLKRAPGEVVVRDEFQRFCYACSICHKRGHVCCT